MVLTTECYADLDQGATRDFPIQGCAVTAAWAKKYPNTLKAFTTALSQGKQIADTDRAAVEQVLQIPVLTCLACRGHLQIAGPVRALVRERLMVPASPFPRSCR